MAEIPHIAWPLRLDEAGRLQVVEQGTIEHLRQNVRVLRRTPLGARVLAPGVGVPDPTFTSGVDPVALTRRLTDDENGEPRANVTVKVTPLDAGRQTVSFHVGFAGETDIDEEES